MIILKSTTQASWKHSLLFTKQTVWNCWNKIEKQADRNYLVNLLLVSGKVVGVGPNHVEKLEISLLSSSSFHLRLFYQSEHLFLNIFEQDLQPYEAKRVSCVPSRTLGRALRSRRQCTGSPAWLFMIKGVERCSKVVRSSTITCVARQRCRSERK